MAYLILRVSGLDRYIEMIENSQESKDNWVVQGREFTYWSEEISGTFPMIDSQVPWTDPRAYDIKRLCGYICDSDLLYTKYICSKDADGDIASTARDAWIAKRNEIKSKYPKP